ncbi:hypothetical protein QFC19_001117 [Naganishia cerealis]|uniref:Uncharacterized protein n=1 Tax=Naganishia cerealis TaxID=610337 RepID=A0ACC2WJF8_9TREE|nr:hypothetical protein QFC19_001117 [Naganishia cerealis]
MLVWTPKPPYGIFFTDNVSEFLSHRGRPTASSSKMHQDSRSVTSSSPHLTTTIELGHDSNEENAHKYIDSTNSYAAETVFLSSPENETFVIPHWDRSVAQGGVGNAARRILQRLRNLVRLNALIRSPEDNYTVLEKKARDRSAVYHPLTRPPRWRPMGMYKSVTLIILAAFLFAHTYFGYFPDIFSADLSSETSFTQNRFSHIQQRKSPAQQDGWNPRKHKHDADGSQAHVASHTGRHETKNGLLRVDLNLPGSQHPISQLIDKSQEKWEAKKAKQSTTLKQAVEEYKKRHRGKLPPKGFDKWWKFVIKHNVPLVDEYDNIMRDLSLFGAFSPKELNKRLDRSSKLPDTFTLSFHGGKISTERTQGKIPAGEGNSRIAGQVDLLKEFDVASWLSDCRLAISLHDDPRTLIGYEHRSELISRVEELEFSDNAREINPGEKGWHLACPYSSNARNMRNPQAGMKPDGKHLVADMSSQMDLCTHPYNIPLNGITGRGDKHMDDRLLPIFSLSKTSLNADILIVPTEQWTNSVPLVPWNERKHSKLLWRGSNTGTHYSKSIPWRNSQRIRFVNETRPNAEGAIEYLPPPYHLQQQDSLGAAIIHADKAELNEKFFDVAFVGSPIQCDKQDGTCEELEKSFDFKQTKMSLRESLDFKYVLDILNAVADSSESTLKAEWWNDRSQAWVHYVPVQLDNSDLYDTLAYFRGDEDGNNGDDEAAYKIAAAGRSWFETHIRREDMAAYASRLYLEWARLLANDRGDMDFAYSPRMEIPRGT